MYKEFCTLSHLFDVRAAHALGAPLEALALRLLQVGEDLVVRAAQVRLVRVEHEELVLGEE